MQNFFFCHSFTQYQSSQNAQTLGQFFDLLYFLGPGIPRGVIWKDCFVLSDMGAAIWDKLVNELANDTGDQAADLWCMWHVLTECTHTWQFVESQKGSTCYHRNWNPDWPVHLWSLVQQWVSHYWSWVYVKPSSHYFCQSKRFVSIAFLSFVYLTLPIDWLAKLCSVSSH